MFKVLLRRHAGMLIGMILSASTPNFAQQIKQSAPMVEPQQSIISLAPALKPQGFALARQSGDAKFERSLPNYHVFAAVGAGENAAAEVLTLNFAGQTRLTEIKSKNKDFVIEPGGTCYSGNSYSKGDSCSLVVRFTPQGAGKRLGFITVKHSAEASLINFGLLGNGYSPIISFIPSFISTVTGTVSSGVGTIKSATNMTIDGGDTLYVADIGNNLIKEIDSTGVVNTLTPFFATPASLAVDSMGIIYTTNTSASSYYFSYFMPWGSQTAYGNTYAGGTCTPSAPCSLTSVGMNRPANMSIDAYDNLYFEEGTKGAAEMPVTNISGGTGSFSLWYLTDQFTYSTGTPASFAADASGNIYNDYTYTAANTCFLLGETNYSAEYSPTAIRVAGGVRCGFSGDGGLASGAEISTTIGQIAFDKAGNLYFVDAGNQRVRKIEASTGLIHTIAGTGLVGYVGDGSSALAAKLANPTGLAVDSRGQVYILSGTTSSGTDQVIRKVGTLGYVSFGSGQLVNTVSAPKMVIVSNNGNTSMVLTSASFVNPASNQFAIDPVTTNCNLSAGATLAAGASCNIGILFKPTTAGFKSTYLRMLNNTAATYNDINIGGTAALPSATFKITSPTSGQSFSPGTSVTFTATVTSASGSAPTGTVQFKVDGANSGSPVTISAGTASKSITGLTTTSHTFSATYSGDSNYAPGGPISTNITVASTLQRAPTTNGVLKANPSSRNTPAAPTTTRRVIPSTLDSE